MIIFRQTPDSFLVAEDLFYDPSGEGDCVFVQIEKRGMSTFRAKRRLSEWTGVPVGEIRHAGLKDTEATARQWFSWKASQQKSEVRESDDLRILTLTRHTNNLSIGHVRSNRFRIRLEATAEDSLPEHLDGPFPNLYGPQRFGRTYPDRETIRADIHKPSKRREGISAIQSWLFNDYAGHRIGELGRGYRPDDLWTATNGKTWFKPEAGDPELEDRYARGEISPTGPMFGYRVTLVESEIAWLADHYEIEASAFRPWGKIARGARRPLWIKPADVGAERRDSAIELEFTLPSGAYATVYLTALFSEELSARGTLSNWPDYTRPVVLSGSGS